MVEAGHHVLPVEGGLHLTVNDVRLTITKAEELVFLIQIAFRHLHQIHGSQLAFEQAKRFLLGEQILTPLSKLFIRIVVTIFVFPFGKRLLRIILESLLRGLLERIVILIIFKQISEPEHMVVQGIYLFGIIHNLYAEEVVLLFAGITSALERHILILHLFRKATADECLIVPLINS